jgi:hypothetical protein
MCGAKTGGREEHYFDRIGIKGKKKNYCIFVSLIGKKPIRLFVL